MFYDINIIYSLTGGYLPNVFTFVVETGGNKTDYGTRK